MISINRTCETSTERLIISTKSKGSSHYYVKLTQDFKSRNEHRKKAKYGLLLYYARGTTLKEKVFLIALQFDKPEILSPIFAMIGLICSMMKGSLCVFNASLIILI